MTEANSASMGSVHRELDKVLGSLTGADLYRDNAFRVTGLATDASPRQVRRGREELMNPYYAPPEPDEGAPLPPSTDADALQHAFEALRDPLLRLTHELLWLRPDEDDKHNLAVRGHCAAVEAAADGGDGWGEWAESLRLWSEVLSDDRTWKRAKERVREIDDPRLTLAATRALRSRLPAHIIGVNIEFAAQAAAEGDTGGAEHHMRVLRESPFGKERIREAARAAVRPIEARVNAACETATEDAASARGLDAARRVLADTEGPLRVITALLGAEDPLTRACRDEVASTVNRCAVGYFNKQRKTGDAPALLQRARRLAASDATIELIDRNIEVMGTDPVIEEVAEFVKAGRVDAAAARLRAWHDLTRDPDRKAALAKVLADRRSLSSPPEQPNATGCVFFLGSELYGGADEQLEPEANAYTKITTKYLTFLWIPIMPISAHIVGPDIYGGRVPLSPGATRFRRVSLILLPALALYLYFPGVNHDLAAGAWLIGSVITSVLRAARLRSWAKAREEAA